jgi:hypothetical protein
VHCVPACKGKTPLCFYYSRMLAVNAHIENDKLLECIHYIHNSKCRKLCRLLRTSSQFFQASKNRPHAQRKMCFFGKTRQVNFPVRLDLIKPFSYITLQSKPGLPDLSWYMIPKREKMLQMNKKCTKWSYNIPNVCKIFQMAIKYINSFQSRASQIYPNRDLGLKINHLATLVQDVKSERCHHNQCTAAFAAPGRP